MADYCKECSIYWFGKDYHNLSNLITKHKCPDPKTCRVDVICECCGVVAVNKNGKALDCNQKQCLDTCHKKGK